MEFARVRGQVAIAAVAAVVLSDAGAATAPAWSPYTNARYGFVVEIPAAGFRAEAPPENGDGQAWTSTADGGTIRAYAGYLVVVPSFAEYRDWLISAARDEGFEVSYQTGGKGWFVYSGSRSGDIVYERVLSACGGEVTVSVRFDYPSARKKDWDPVVSHVAKSLQAGEGAACP